MVLPFLSPLNPDIFGKVEGVFTNDSTKPDEVNICPVCKSKYTDIYITKSLPLEYPYIHKYLNNNLIWEEWKKYWKSHVYHHLAMVFIIIFNRPRPNYDGVVKLFCATCVEKLEREFIIKLPFKKLPLYVNLLWLTIEGEKFFRYRLRTGR